ncbi:unnamed protein product [Owenia fusiformis]|uniref:Importin-11 n=1 Tax=Owenia fusiformis TaxID=6347 RepID=A0A8J1TW98_OWEFU|nr:unnamed protein product [Owenia fusiformis]
MELQTAGPVVLETLIAACSQNAEEMHPAEQRLKQWETQPGFYTILVSVLSDHSLDVNVRWLAVLYFKNGIDRYWRKTAPGAIPETEKTSLRTQLISKFNEPVDQIAVQIAVLIGKIARLDCPRHWPELMPTLLEAVKCKDTFIQHRSMLTLYHTIKGLASKRLAMDRKVFEEFTTNVFGFILTLWNSQMEEFLHSVDNAETLEHKQLFVLMAHSHLTLKVARKLCVFGFKDTSKNEHLASFLNMVFKRLKTMLDIKFALFQISNELQPKREKMIILLSKVLLDVQETYSHAYIPWIRESLELTVQYNFGEQRGLVFDRFTVNCFNLIRAILRSDAYRPAKVISETENPKIIEAYKTKAEFFTYNTLAEICKRIVSQYFLLSSEDLNCWDTSPEEYISDEGGDSWKFSLRPCTENLFLSLIKEYRSSLTPVVLEIIRECHGPIDPDDVTAVLRKDAVYNCVGLASFDLYDDVDFDQWFNTSLIQELKIKHSNYRIIRRRVIWLIGQWVGVKMSPNLRPALYENILPLLADTEDMVVRIEAADTLKTCVDDFEFKVESFLPYLESMFGLLFGLLRQVEECETKMHVLNVMSFVIERVGVEVRPHSHALIQYLPLLWQESEDHNMLRCAILTTLVHLVQGLGTLSVSMYNFLLPVIRLSTDVHAPPHVYLLEDGLLLWLATLHTCPTITMELLQLYTNMPELLELGSDTLRVCLKVIEAYLLLAPNEFIKMYNNSLLNSLVNMLPEMRSEGQVMVLKLVELVFKLFPSEGPQLFSPILHGCLEGMLDGEEIPMVMAMHISLLARTLLQNSEYFWSFLEQFAKSSNNQSNVILESYLSVWVERLDNITQSGRRKLSGLAVASLLTFDLRPVIDKFPDLINICVEVLHDVCNKQEDEEYSDCLVIADDVLELPEDALDTEHDKRKRNISKRDPVHSVSIKDYLMSQLQMLQTVKGTAEFDRIMATVDTEILAQLKEFIH